MQNFTKKNDLIVRTPVYKARVKHPSSFKPSKLVNRKRHRIDSSRSLKSSAQKLEAKLFRLNLAIINAIPFFSSRGSF